MREIISVIETNYVSFYRYSGSDVLLTVMDFVDSFKVTKDSVANI